MTNEQIIATLQTSSRIRVQVVPQRGLREVLRGYQTAGTVSSDVRVNPATQLSLESILGPYSQNRGE